jgi:hypothetical protein
MKPLFDPAQFGRKLSVAIHLMELDLRTAAKQIGTSHSTVCRVCNGGVPDVENYLRIQKWMTDRTETLAQRMRSAGF